MSNIIIMNNGYKDENAVDTVMKYCYGHKVSWGGFGVNRSSIEDSISSMKYIKKYYNQEYGRQLAHVVINAYSGPQNGRYTREMSLRDWGLLENEIPTIGCHIFEAGYQNCFFTHYGNNGIWHVHFVINTVNRKTGNKLASDKELFIPVLQHLCAKTPQLNWQGMMYNDDSI